MILLYILFGTLLFSSSASAVKVGECFIKMENRTFAFEEGTVGPKYTTETAQDCLEKCVGMVKCMAYTYEFSKKECSIFHFYPDIGNNDKKLECKESCVTYFVGLPSYCYDISTKYDFFGAHLKRLEECNSFANLCKSVYILQAEANYSKLAVEKMKTEYESKSIEHEIKFLDLELLRKKDFDALNSELNVTKRTVQSQQDTMNTLKMQLDVLERNILNKCYMNGFEYDKGTGICYKYIGETLTWEDARQNCKKLDSDLFSIHSKQENVLATSIVDKLTWIGLTDKETKGTFQWSDGSPVRYTNWFMGEQPVGGKSEKCVSVFVNWISIPCFYKWPSICRK